MTARTALPYARERFVAEVASVMREIGLRNEDRNGTVRHLRVGIMRTHDAVHIAHEDWLDLQRAKLAVTASGEVIAAGFNLNQGGEKEWMHDSFVDTRGRFLAGF